VGRRRDWCFGRQIEPGNENDKKQTFLGHFESDDSNANFPNIEMTSLVFSHKSAAKMLLFLTFHITFSQYSSLSQPQEKEE
jgi:hypothetical protein